MACPARRGARTAKQRESRPKTERAKASVSEDLAPPGYPAQASRTSRGAVSAPARPFAVFLLRGEGRVGVTSRAGAQERQDLRQEPLEVDGLGVVVVAAGRQR